MADDSKGQKTHDHAKAQSWGQSFIITGAQAKLGLGWNFITLVFIGWWNVVHRLWIPGHCGG